MQTTAATFAPRASTATKNPAVPGTALCTVFEVQGYVSEFTLSGFQLVACSRNNIISMLMPVSLQQFLHFDLGTVGRMKKRL
ncbi:hypothetical protein V6N11_001247 [Hibiscus sabdariffa]|uniref:Uncharacterized protein n=1 Tax=Hibiscus sabdariffa TaxID=183260 RepID=A0ABR2RZF8_9ROSI